MSQLNFFLFNDDILLRLESLIKKGEVELFRGRFFENEFPDPVIDINEVRDISQLTFWFKNVVKKPKCYLITHGVNDGLFTFDYYKDPIMHFSDCIRTPNLISPGRIFYKAGWIEDAQLRKNHEKWTKRVSRLFDKDLMKIDGFWRISNSVINWVNSERCLELGTGGFRINKENLNSRLPAVVSAQRSN